MTLFSCDSVASTSFRRSRYRGFSNIKKRPVSSFVMEWLLRRSGFFGGANVWQARNPKPRKEVTAVVSTLLASGFLFLLQFRSVYIRGSLRLGQTFTCEKLMTDECVFMLEVTVNEFI